MSTYIHHEIFLLIQSVITGAALFLCYDLLKALRKVVPHLQAVISGEDVVYWIFCAFFIFAQVYRNNQGILRFFIIFGILTGAVTKKIIKWLLFPVRRCKLFKYRHVKKERLANWGILRKKERKEK